MTCCNDLCNDIYGFQAIELQIKTEENYILQACLLTEQLLVLLINLIYSSMSHIFLKILPQSQSNVWTKHLRLGEATCQSAWRWWWGWWRWDEVSGWWCPMLHSLKMESVRWLHPDTGVSRRQSWIDLSSGVSSITSVAHQVPFRAYSEFPSTERI